MVIMTVALVSLAELMAITLRMQMLGRNQTAGVRLAQDKLDELMTQNFNTAPAVAIGGSLVNDNWPNHFDDPSDGGDNVYKRRWVVAAGPADPGVPANSIRVITVRVIPLVNDLRTAPPTDLTTIIRCWPCA